MTQNAPKFQEEYSAKIPALALLINTGWQFLSPEQNMQARNQNANEVVLREVLREELQKRRFTFNGKEYPLSDKAIDNLLSEVCSPALNEGLSVANERIYNHLLYGISVTEFVDGKKANPTIALIDWYDLSNNSFIFTEEFRVLSTNGVNSRYPDIVCFVNGLPLAVIEAKRPNGNAQKGPTIDEGVSQNIRNQRNDEIPQLFAYSQLLLSINGIEGRYGTQGTSKPFWAAWVEEDISDAEFYATKNKKLNAEQLDSIFNYRPAPQRRWYEQLISGGDLHVTGQDKIIISLLSPT